MMASRPVRSGCMTCSAWCSTCSRARTPTALHSMYEELGAYGTSASIIVDDFDSVIHHPR